MRGDAMVDMATAFKNIVKEGLIANVCKTTLLYIEKSG
jgi:hypothetical protein